MLTHPCFFHQRIFAEVALPERQTVPAVLRQVIASNDSLVDVNCSSGSATRTLVLPPKHRLGLGTLTKAVGSTGIPVRGISELIQRRLQLLCTEVGVIHKS